MTKTRVFISFDYDHDLSLKNLLVGQANNPDSPFELANWSVNEPFSGDWKEKVRLRMRQTDQVAVICGEYTDKASGVNVEVTIAQEENLPYFLLYGYSDKSCVKPKTAKDSDKIYNWTWNNLKLLIAGNR